VVSGFDCASLKWGRESFKEDGVSTDESAGRICAAQQGVPRSREPGDRVRLLHRRVPWDETADIFSRNGWKELSYVGAYVGRERTRQSLKRRYPNPKSPNFLTIRQVVQPVIHVSADGRSAKIRRRLFQLGGPVKGEGDRCTVPQGAHRAVPLSQSGVRPGAAIAAAVRGISIEKAHHSLLRISRGEQRRRARPS
jgi:hypothetical protein